MMKFLNSLDRKTITVAGIIVAAIFLFFVNVLSTLEINTAQVDLTQNKLFTLSKGSRKIIATIDEPITFRFYYSNKLGQESPQHGNYAKRVRELLQHYAEIAGGKIQLRIINPEPFSVEEDEAVRLGMQGIPLDQSGELAYFGLAATNSTDDRRTIAFFNPQREQFLEYDITRLIYELTNPEKRKVGLLTSLPMEADPALQYQPWPILQQVSQFFDITSLDSDTAVIDKDISVLFIAHPRFLKDKALYAVDQYIMHGGHAVVLIDPYNESTRMMPNRPPGAGSSDLKKLFDTWGIEMTPDEFVGDQDSAVRVSAPVNGRDVIATYLSWNQFDKHNLDPKDVVTGQLNSITVASAGSLSLAKDSPLKMTPLLESGENAGLLSTDLVKDSPNPQELLEKFKPAHKRFVIAARFSGEVKSAFPEGVPPPDPKDKDKPVSSDTKKADPKDFLAKSNGPIDLIVMADSDFLNARFWLQQQQFFGQETSVPIANNADFVVNALDNLSGSGDLISLRSRGLSIRPFYRIINIRNQAERKYSATEKELQAHLKELQDKVSKLKVSDDKTSQMILTTQQRRELNQSRTELLSVRKQLRDVQLALREDIERLDNILKVINIWAMPLLVALVAVILALFRRRSYRQRTIQG